MFAYGFLRYVKNIFIWLPCFLTAAMAIFFTLRTVQAENTVADGAQKPAIENLESDFQPLEQEKPKAELAPSSTGMGETTEILIRFMILWSIIYLVIKFVRMWLDKHK